MNLKQKLLDAAKVHSKRTGLSIARISTIVMNDGKFFDKLKAGKSCTIDTYEKVMAWFADNTPAEDKQLTQD